MSEDSLVVPQPGPANGHTLVVADGNSDAAESLATVLRLNGFTVESANNGQKALALITDRRPAAVILTLALPGLDGFEVARRTCRYFAGADRPLLIALTGYGRDEDRELSRSAGFDHHLLKPADPLELVALIRDGLADPS